MFIIVQIFRAELLMDAKRDGNMKIGRCIVMGWALYMGCHVCEELIMDRFKIPHCTSSYGVVE